MLTIWGELERVCLNVTKAKSLLSRAEALYRELDVRQGVANACRCLGDLQRDHGDVRAARDLLTEARQLYELAGDVEGLADALIGLAQLDVDGDTPAARLSLDRARELCREGQYRHGLAQVEKVEGDLKRRSGDDESARVRYEEAANLFRELGDCRGQAEAIMGVAEMLRGVDDDSAREYYFKAGHLFESADMPKRKEHALQKARSAPPAPS